MDRRATIIDIARAAGVSKSTVSLVLNDSPQVKPATRDAVRRAMDSLGYVYNRSAANLRNPRSRIVGMVINDLANPFFAELAIGIERVLRTSGTVPFLAHTNESRVRQAEVVRSMREHGAAGLILCPTADSDADEIASILALGIPVVLAIRRVEGAHASLVCSDNRAGARRVTRHLVGLGHRRIAFMGGSPPTCVRQDRIAGYRDALDAAGLSFDPGLVIDSAPSKEGGFAAMAALLARGDRPCATVCFNDVVAIGAMLALSRHGLAAGLDMAVTGFDDTVEARQVSPALTTVSVGCGDLGERAAQMLLRRMAGASHDIETYIGEARLMIRQSSGPPRPDIGIRTEESRRLALT